MAAAQIVTRMQLTWYGTPATSISQVAVAFQVMVMIMIAYCCTRAFVFLVIAYLDPNTEPDLPRYVDPPPTYFFFAALDDFLSYMYFAFTVIVLRNVRSHLRQKHAIPESDSTCVPGCEDICCSLFCPCFVAGKI